MLGNLHMGIVVVYDWGISCYIPLNDGNWCSLIPNKNVNLLYCDILLCGIH